jgi:hypothetical protein
MTRKDFELIAVTIKDARAITANALEKDLLNILANRFAAVLAGTNAQFNRDKFLRACGCDAH